MSVTAVVLGYWPNRLPNVTRIVNDLLTGTVVPDRIIVVLQGHVALEPLHSGQAEHEGWWDGTVQIVRTKGNFRTRAKFVAALLELADWYLLMDDDTSVGRRTVEHLIEHPKMVDTLTGWVTGYWGVTLNGDSFMTGTIHQPALIDKPMLVDGFHGRAVFASHAALTRMFQRELELRKDELGNMAFPHEGDDIIVGLTGNGWLVPMRGDECFVDLDECGQALQYNTEPNPDGEHYFDLRDRFTAHVLKRL